VASGYAPNGLDTSCHNATRIDPVNGDNDIVGGIQAQNPGLGKHNGHREVLVSAEKHNRQNRLVPHGRDRRNGFAGVFGVGHG
jgi:hypothetical protein